VLELRTCSIDEIQAAPNMAEVLAEYAAESSLPEPAPQWDTYRTLEAAGHIHPIGAFDDARLVGFVFPIIGPLPHYGTRTATVESFFVLKSERHRNIGIRLMQRTEQLARALGAAAILYSAPAMGALSRLLRVLPAYRHSNEVFVRELA
jgi:GNAT superfamily N-acetyltransferase